MATTPDEIKSYLDQHGLKYRHEPGSSRFQSGFATDTYRNADGEYTFAFSIYCDNDGQTVRLLASNIFNLSPKASAKCKTAVWQTLHRINWLSAFVHFEYDINDGEIRAVYNIHLADSPLSKDQLMRAVYRLPTAIEQCSPDIRRAIDFGIPLLDQSTYEARFEKYIRQRSPSSAP